MALFCRLPKPFQGFCIVFGYTLTFFIHDTYVIHGIRISSFCCDAAPQMEYG